MSVRGRSQVTGTLGKYRTARVAVLFISWQLVGAAVDITQPLFVIERNTNANVVHYDANLTAGGDLDPARPVMAYWIMSAQDGRREELTSFERSRAYGFTLEPGHNPNSYRLALVAQKQRDIEVYRQGGTVRAETVIGGRPAYLKRIFVSSHRVLAVPTVRYFELCGTDVATGRDICERVQPGASSER